MWVTLARRFNARWNAFFRGSETVVFNRLDIGYHAAAMHSIIPNGYFHHPSSVARPLLVVSFGKLLNNK
jgi:hypothetical protein